MEGFAVLREWHFADVLEIEFQRLVFSCLPYPPNKKACDYQQACYKLSDVDGHSVLRNVFLPPHFVILRLRHVGDVVVW